MNWDQYISRFDGLLSLVGVIGLYPVLKRLWSQEILNPIEKRLRSLFMWMFVLFLIRFPFFFWDIDFLGPWVYFCALGMLFNVGLYFEVLLRRHFPLWFKVFISVGCLFFVTLAFSGLLVANLKSLIAFGIFVILTQTIAVLLCLFRDQNSLSKLENSLVNNSIVSLLLIAPLFLSDVTTFEFEILPRMGVLGAILFAYVSLFDQGLSESRAQFLGKIGRSVLVSGLVTLIVSTLMIQIERIVLIRYFLLFLILTLIYRIYGTVKNLDGHDEISQFVKYLNQSSKKSVFEFLSDFQDHFEKLGSRIFSRESQKNYDMDHISRLFHQFNTNYFSFNEVQELILRKEYQKDWFYLEQLSHLLENEQMTHICKLGSLNPYYVLLNVPFVSYRNRLDLQMTLMAEMAELIEKKMEKVHHD